MNVIKDDMKRYISVKVEIDNVKYNLWNFHGPNNENQKFAFVDLISNLFKDHDAEGHNILGGDFNINLDKIGNSKIRDKLFSCLSKNDLKDAWRLKHFNEKKIYLAKVKSALCVNTRLLVYSYSIRTMCNRLSDIYSTKYGSSCSKNGIMYKGCK